MDYLQKDQIPFDTVCLEPFSGSFKMAIISNRLYRLILKKGTKWRVLQVPIKEVEPSDGIMPVLVSPTHGSVLFIKEKHYEI